MRTERIIQADRYLPCRKANSSEHSWRQDSHSHSSTAASSIYLDLIASSSQRCLTFTKTANEGQQSSLTFGKSRQYLTETSLRQKEKKTKRVIKLQAERIVEVPGIQNNFYFSSFDLSSQKLLAIGLKKQVFLYNTSNELTFELNQEMELMVYKNYSTITSLKFNCSNSLLFSGKEDGSLDIIDLHKLKNIRTVKGHLSRIGCIENTEEWGFLSGSKDKIVIHNDIRVKNSTILKVLAHKNEVCGLAFKNNTVASGSNDGRVNIWDLRNKNSFISKKFHQSAAKALQWCPWKLELLASGSGSKDPQIILWNNHEENIEKILNSKNQVTALKWRQHTKDLVTVHGSSSGYGLIWDPETGKCTTFLSGHQGRILGLAVDGNKGVWTIGADETMRFWRTGSEENIIQDFSQSSMMDLMLK